MKLFWLTYYIVSKNFITCSFKMFCALAYMYFVISDISGELQSVKGSSADSSQI